MKLLVIRVVFLCLVAVFSGAEGKAQCTEINRYVASLAYLRIDYSFDKLLNDTFGKGSRKRSKRCFSLTTSKSIRFIPLSSHETLIRKSEILASNNSLMLDRNSFYSKYFFEPTSCDELDIFSSGGEAGAVVVFSKPFGDFLLAEVLDHRLSLGGAVRNGKAIRILFVFDNDGYVSSSYYNVVTF